jgi:hypothetical protein
MADKDMFFLGDSKVSGGSVEMTFRGGVAGNGEVATFKSPTIKRFESVVVIGHDQDGAPTIETKGWGLKCFVKKR